MIIVKHHSSIQIAHLYEHLFCAQVNKLFYQEGLFPYLDYSLVGRTYHRGIIFIDILTYTPEARKLVKQIHHLDIDMGKRSVTVAISQMLAEEEKPFESLGYDIIKKELETLHTQPWQDLDNVDFIDPKNVRRKSNSLYLVKGKSLPARKLTISIDFAPDFAKEHRELVPLFRLLTLLINANLRVGLAERFGYYSVESKYKNTTRVVGLTSVFHVAYSQGVNLEQIISAYLDEIAYLKKQSAFKRLLTDLQNVSHANRPYLAPNPESNFEDTHRFIGAKGWKIIATQQNYNTTLKHMSVSVSFGRKKLRTSKF